WPGCRSTDRLELFLPYGSCTAPDANRPGVKVRTPWHSECAALRTALDRVQPRGCHRPGDHRRLDAAARVVHGEGGALQRQLGMAHAGVPCLPCGTPFP